MTATPDSVTKKAEPTAEAEAARELVRLAPEQGLSLTGLAKRTTVSEGSRVWLSGCAQAGLSPTSARGARCWLRLT